MMRTIEAALGRYGLGALPLSPLLAKNYLTSGSSSDYALLTTIRPRL